MHALPGALVKVERRSDDADDKEMSRGQDAAGRASASTPAQRSGAHTKHGRAQGEADGEHE